jgi:hypothetical protein
MVKRICIGINKVNGCFNDGFNDALNQGDGLLVNRG